MRLQQIKLSGFKSFVDPTSLILQRNLSSVVGPNGCGKSNIVDAILWVMGESSARYLRGESLSDVIFNGSRHRAAVDRASVELIFDNSAGRIQGRYASYQEISIRRELDRESNPGYFLNGTRCRRKDIQGIFHGTGLGPRSYSVIEQGMISRLIEAKPEELRAHLEEAAGVSKYRQARRETENRIRNTRENISRLNDIRGEIENQLKVLQRQAKTAERYRTLQAEEQRLQWELWALGWKDLEDRYQQQQSACRERELALEQERTGLQEQERELVERRDRIEQESRECDREQEDFYKFNTGMARLEQDIQHARERIAELAQAQERFAQDSSLEQRHYQGDQHSLKLLEEERETLQPTLQKLEEGCLQAEQQLQDASQELRVWQEHWDHWNDEAAQISRQYAESKTRLEHLNEQRRGFDADVQSLRSELQGLDPSAAEHSLHVQRGGLEALEQVCQDLEQREQDARGKLAELRSEVAELEPQREPLNAEAQELHASISSLEALQKAALGADQQAVQDWLQQADLGVQERLGECLRVESHWRQAVELALGFHLQSVPVSDLDQVLRALPELAAGEFGACQEGARVDPEEESRGLLALREYVRSPELPADLLRGFYAAEDLPCALRLREQLRSGEVLVTPDGVLLGRDWVRVVRGIDGQGILDREVELEQGRKQYAQVQDRRRALEDRLAQLRADAQVQEAACQELHRDLRQQREQWSEHRSTLAVVRERAEHQRARAGKIEQDTSGLEARLEALSAEIEQGGISLQELEAGQQQSQQLRAELLLQREQYEQVLEECRERQSAAREEKHRIDLRLEGLNMRHESLAGSMERHRELRSQLLERGASLQEERSRLEMPLPEQQQQLEDSLSKRRTLEQRLRERRERLEHLQEQWRQLDGKRADGATSLREQEEELQEERMQSREIRVRRDSIAEQLQEAGGVLEQVLQGLVEDAGQEPWRERLERVRRRIQQLGQVNLAAIGEHSQHAERKEFLDRQHQDLETALETLEQAMRRIDRETRSRFKQVFGQVNENLQELFPRLFGGGSAELTLSGENLLESGVTFMARPPGKRNSSIHLLSGGEKALAALALIFSIFQLNPSPLCLLDEVDAPLDDPNILRFGELVRSMSDKIQFVVITHNKITMEIADTLFGVTMQEAGVSRIVAVDVDKAVRMAATA